MREVINLLRGLALQVSGDVRWKNLIDLWAYQTEVIFSDQLSSQADINVFRALLGDQLLELDSNSSNAYLLGSEIFIPGIDRENSGGLFNNDGLYHVAPPNVLDEATFPNLISGLKEKFSHIARDKIHRGAVVDSIKISSKILYSNLNVILVESNLKNHNEMASIAAYFGGLRLHKFNGEGSSNADLKASWKTMLNGIYHEIFNSRRLQVLYLRFQDLEYSWQWEDIMKILSKSIPVSYFNEIRDLKFSSGSLSEISKISLCSKMLKIVFSIESPDELRKSLALYPFLIKGAIIHWIHPLNPITSTSVTMELLDSSFWSKFPDLLPSQSNVSEFAFAIFKEYAEFPSKTYHIINHSLPDPYDQFCNMIIFFKKICLERGPILDNQHKKFKSALSKIKAILELLDDIELYYYKCRKVINS
jgi:hypothetical protein